VFAPTDDAFGKLPDGIECTHKTGEQRRFDLHFDLPCSCWKIMSTDLSDGMKDNEREEVTVHLKEGKVFINDAEVVLADVTTDNGVIHAVIR
jgi:uncharacterized surface protein with fasciclin (FAS1) repeats